MNYFKIVYKDGNIVQTGFNGTIEEAREYYEGRYFNFGIEDDKMVKAIKVYNQEEKLYDLIVKKENGEKIYLTGYPMNHKECEIMKSKQSKVTINSVQFEEVV